MDDFNISAKNKSTINEVIEANGLKFRFIGNADLLNCFNSVDNDQCREYILIHCDLHIDRIVGNHGWLKPRWDAGRKIEPIHPDAVK